MRYKNMFERLKEKNEGAFIPFLTLLDPTPQLSQEIIKTVIDAGADALELGIAFSDPIADGPVIQKSALRAIKSGSTVEKAFELVANIRKINQDIPIGILTYANLVFNNTPEQFYSLAKKSGVDSVLIADLPMIEAKPFFNVAKSFNIDPILIAPINMDLKKVLTLAKLSSGYTYVVTRSGVTGANENISYGQHKDLIKAIKDNNAPNAIFGFGISTPDHVRKAIEQGASGAISGSKLVSLIENNLLFPDRMLEQIHNFVKDMKEATNRLSH